MHSFRGTNVATGDVLLKQSANSASHIAIQVGQKLGGMSGGNSDIVHAAIYVGSVPGASHAIAESVGSGLRLAEPNSASTFTWSVWHLSGNEELRHMAADIASNLVAKAEVDQGFGSYNTSGATKSAFSSSNPNKHAVPDTLSHDMLNDFTSQNGECRSFFCSNFVVLAYAIAAQALGLAITSGINLNYKYSSPAEMYKFFARTPSWVLKGQITNAY